MGSEMCIRDRFSLKKVIIFEREIIKRLILPSTNFIRKIKVRGSKVTDLGRLRKRDT